LSLDSGESRIQRQFHNISPVYGALRTDGATSACMQAAGAFVRILAIRIPHKHPTVHPAGARPKGSRHNAGTDEVVLPALLRVRLGSALTAWECRCRASRFRSRFLANSTLLVTTGLGGWRYLFSISPIAPSPPCARAQRRKCLESLHSSLLGAFSPQKPLDYNRRFRGVGARLITCENV